MLHPGRLHRASTARMSLLHLGFGGLGGQTPRALLPEGLALLLRRIGESRG